MKRRRASGRRVQSDQVSRDADLDASETEQSEGLATPASCTGSQGEQRARRREQVAMGERSGGENREAEEHQHGLRGGNWVSLWGSSHDAAANEEPAS